MFKTTLTFPVLPVSEVHSSENDTMTVQLLIAVSKPDMAKLVLRLWYWELVFLCGLSPFLLVTCCITTE